MAANDSTTVDVVVAVAGRLPELRGMLAGVRALLAPVIDALAERDVDALSDIERLALDATLAADNLTLAATRAVHHLDDVLIAPTP